MPDRPRIAIIGAGIAGISAALTAIDRNADVTLFESRKRPGGRCASFPHDGLELDTGQHLMLGCYTQFIQMNERLGVSDDFELFESPGMSIHLGSKVARIRTLPLPAPLHLLPLLWTLKPVSLRERVRLSLAIQSAHRAPDSSTVMEWLLSHRLNSYAILLFWKLIVESIYNTPMEHIRMGQFKTVIQMVFLDTSRAIRPMLNRRGFSEIYFDALERLESKGQLTLRLGARVRSMRTNKFDISLTSTLQTEIFDAVICAVPPHALQHIGITAPKIEHRPIMTIYFVAPDAIFADRLNGYPETGIDWIFALNHFVDNGNRLYSAVLSNSGNIDRDLAVERLSAVMLDRAPCASWTILKIIEEKRATIDQSPTSESLRPKPGPYHPRVYIAGDWTATGLPATIEGACRSGIECAEKLMDWINDAN